MTMSSFWCRLTSFVWVPVLAACLGLVAGIEFGRTMWRETWGTP